ncbi:glycosyltransferase family 57 protein [Cristinia sonorae]|uniref:Alpha-1,3-glucosyltransferase n=1 Tax=Cristinia sonorae TaxID=1940300 RepID=A0A8K0XTP1_9AGAR|nr:glycosyltransferase family 57 protein [Cristinia sonorae]
MSTGVSPPTDSATLRTRSKASKEDEPASQVDGPREEEQPKQPRTWAESWRLDMANVDWDTLYMSLGLKFLLFRSYRSTDFEVHRNWLAITHSLPISKWYYDTTSEWTLDYPPFFAYFEKLLSIPASLIDPKIVDLDNLGYDALPAVLYQRTTVVVTELLLGFVLLRFIRGSVDPSLQRLISASIYMHPGFLIVDHMHFQYNGFLFGILLWSILMARNGNKLASGFLFAVLLNFKHIFMYLAPAYFIYLLRSFCLSPSGELLPMHFLSLANTVILVFTVSLGPFFLMGQIPQLLSRLFPFTRGLNHAYWAPNAWAMVTFADRVLLKVVQYFNIASVAINEAGVVSASRGLVGDTIFAVLPNVKPIHTFIITGIFQAIFLVKLWRIPTYKSFVTALTLCGYTSYMFGWHVHEKAILLVLIPLSLLAAENHAFFRTYMIISITGIFSLFPLLFTPAESVVKVVYLMGWSIFVLIPLNHRTYEFPASRPFVVIDILEKVYLTGFVLLQVLFASWAVIPQAIEYWTYIHTDPLKRPPKQDTPVASTGMEFLPLMMTSVYCAVGLIWGFLRLSVLYLRQSQEVAN